MTVDYPEDFELVKNIIKYFGDSLSDIQLHQIIEFLNDNPSLLLLNKDIEAFSGWQASLKEDKAKGCQ